MKAILETDNNLVYSRITAARSVIADRLSASGSISEYEREEIERALHGLDVLERERVPRDFDGFAFRAV